MKRKYGAGDEFKLLEDFKVFKKGDTVSLYEDRFCGINGISICVCYGKKNFKMEFIPFTILKPLSPSRV